MKLVLAAAMWNNPHMLVLDEPTNYLDRESLGALATAIQDFQGCVVMISHNSGVHGVWLREFGDLGFTALAQLRCARRSTQGS